jgi:ssRNA-specific RNase YbeY (16S rRNA maturation enzyme)
MLTPHLLNPPDNFTIRPGIIEMVFKSISEQIDIAQAGTVNIAFLGDDEIQNLNNSYRGIDATTDVLSFHYFEDFE